MKILNVDDNDSSRYAKSRTLQRAGFTVCEAGSGAEALRLVMAEQPDLVLLAVQLPDINGFEVCRRMKSHPAMAAVMIVQMSASFIEGQDRVRRREEDADAYLTEPVQPEDLMATITGLLRLRQIEVELRETRDALETRVHRRTTELQRAIRALRRQNTRRARSEKALQAAYQFLQSTLDALSSHIVILDEAGIILEVNASWRDFLATHGFTAPFDSRGMKFIGFLPTVPGTDVASAQAVVMGTSTVLMRQRETFSCEYACQGDAEPYWFFVRVTRFDGPEGGRIVVVFEHITEVKRAEETMRLQQEALYQSERLASMGAVLASVAHELNNPLAVVQMQLDLLAEELHDSALQDQVAELQQATERCTRIVQNFLTLARRNPPQRTPVQLNAVVQAVLQLLAHTLHLDNVEVYQELADDLPLIGADASQLHQVVVNLVLNAQQAMHDTSGSRCVRLATHYDAARACVTLEVADTGPGIPAALQTRIFEPFFTTKPVGIGTGLGLSVCQGIIESHGGTIRVVSQPGHGAVFCVELPVEAVPAADTLEPDLPLSPPTTPGAILIVDDEVGIARGLARILRRDGHHVETASNGRQALALLEAQAYDLILCDLRMPELDGPGLYHALESRQPDVLERFIFLTGDTLSPEAEAFLQHVGAPRLIKPFSAADGRRAVRQALYAQR